MLFSETTVQPQRFILCMWETVSPGLSGFVNRQGFMSGLRPGLVWTTGLTRCTKGAFVHRRVSEVKEESESSEAGEDMAAFYRQEEIDKSA